MPATPESLLMSSFDIADVVAVGGAIGGIVDFCRQINVEGKLSEKTFKITFDKNELGLVAVLVYLMTSVIVGCGGAFGVQFVLIMLKSFSANQEPVNELLLFSVSIVAGISARHLIPRITERLEEQLFKVQKEAEAAAVAARGATQVAKDAQVASAEFARFTANLRPEATESEVSESIAKLEELLRSSDKEAPTSMERTQTIWLGRLYRRRSDYNKAIEWLDRFLNRKIARQQRDKDFADVLYNKACYLSLQGKLDDALSCLRDSLSIDPGNKSDARTDRDFDPIRSDASKKPILDKALE
jgi:tetratricopeptide (TPR) repeat protein